MTNPVQISAFQGEAGLYAMIQQAPVAMAIITGPDFLIRLANKKQLQLWQKQHEEVAGQLLFDVFPEVEGQGFREKLEQVLRTGVAFKGEQIETQFYRNGVLEYAWFDFVYEPMFNELGIPEGIMVVSTEVTDKVIAQRVLEESERALEKIEAEEEKYRSLFERMDQGFCLVDVHFDEHDRPVDYLFLECNARFEEQTGLKNAPGHTARELVPGLEEHWFRLYGEVARTGIPQNFVEGSEAMGRWFEVHAYKLGDEQSRKVAILFSDITEQKRAEKKLMESEQRFRHLADNAPVMIWMTDREGYCHYLNQQWYDYTGQSIEEAHGLGWTLAVHPEEQALAAEVFLRSSASASPFLLEYRLRRQDGTYRWMIDSAVPRLDPDGNFLGYIGSVVDIHDRKLAEEKLRQLNAHLELSTNSAQVGIWSYNLKTGRLEWSDQHKEMWGYASRDQNLSYEDWYRVILDEDRELALYVVEHARIHRSDYHNEYRIQRVDTGAIRWMRSFGRFIYDEAGEAYLLTGITVEITESKLSEQALRESEERYRRLADELEIIVKDRTKALERSNQDLRQFAHVASHDLKEPIRKILTFHDRLSQEFGSILPERAANHLAKIDKAAKRSQAMIEGLLLSTSIHAADLKTGEQNLNELVRDLETDLEEPMRQKQATLSCDPLPTIEGIHMLLHHLFFNLISNALKFARAGHPLELNITSSAFQKAGKEMVRLVFQDNGIGFSQAHAELIFQPFARLHSKDQYEGAGLGLAFCRQIVERHGGTITAFGEEGAGARFVIELPARQ